MIIEDGASLTIPGGRILHLKNNLSNSEPALQLEGSLVMDGTMRIQNSFGTAVEINENASLNVNGQMSIDNYSGKGLENFGTLTVSQNGLLEIKSNNNQAFLNQLNSTLIISGNLRIN